MESGQPPPALPERVGEQKFADNIHHLEQVQGVELQEQHQSPEALQEAVNTASKVMEDQVKSLFEEQVVDTGMIDRWKKGDGAFTAEDETALKQLRENISPEQALLISDFRVNALQRHEASRNGTATVDVVAEGMLDALAREIDTVQNNDQLQEEEKNNRLRELHKSGRRIFRNSIRPLVRPGTASDFDSVNGLRDQINTEAYYIGENPLLRGQEADGIENWDKAVQTLNSRLILTVPTEPSPQENYQDGQIEHHRGIDSDDIEKIEKKHRNPKPAPPPRPAGVTPPRPAPVPGRQEAAPVAPPPVQEQGQSPASPDAAPAPPAPVPEQQGEQGLEPAPQPVPAEQEPQPGGQDQQQQQEPQPRERFSIGVSNMEEEYRKAAREEAERIYHKELRETPWYSVLKKTKLKMMEGYFKKKWEDQILKVSMKNNNAYVRGSVVKKAIGGLKLGINIIGTKYDFETEDETGGKAATLQAAQSGGEQARYLAQLGNEGFRMEGQQGSKLEGPLRQQFVTDVVEPMLLRIGANTDDETLYEEVQKKIKTFANNASGQANAEDILKELKNNEKFGTDLIKSLRDIKDRSQEAQRGGVEAHNEAMRLIDQETDIYVARARWGAETQYQYRSEKIVDWFQKSNMGFLLSPTVTGVITSAAGTGLIEIMSVQGAAKTVGGLAQFTPPLAGAVLGGLTASLRKRADLERDRGQHVRERAYGQQSGENAKYRTELDRFVYNMESAESLTGGIDGLITQVRNGDAAAERQLAERLVKIKDLLDLSADQKRDLIQFSGRESAAADRMKLLRALSEGNVALKGRMSGAAVNILQAAVGGNEADRRAQYVDDITQKDKAFKRHKNIQAGKAAIGGAATGLIAGTLVSEGLALSARGWLSDNTIGGWNPELSQIPLVGGALNAGAEAVSQQTALEQGIKAGAEAAGLDSSPLNEALQIPGAGQNLTELIGDYEGTGEQVAVTDKINLQFDTNDGVTITADGQTVEAHIHTDGQIIFDEQPPAGIIPQLEEAGFTLAEIPNGRDGLSELIAKYETTSGSETINGMELTFDGNGGVSIQSGAATYEGAIQNGRIVLNSPTPAGLTTQLEAAGMTVDTITLEMNMQDVISDLQQTNDASWHSSFEITGQSGDTHTVDLEGYQMKVGGPTGGDRTMIEFTRDNGMGHIQGRIESNGQITFTSEPTAELTRTLETNGFSINATEITHQEVHVNGQETVDYLSQRGMIANVDHSEYYEYNTPWQQQTEGNELNFDVHKNGDTITLDASRMIGNASYQQGLTPESVNVGDVIHNGNGVVGFRFGNEVPGVRENLMLVKLPTDGQLELNLNAPVSDTVDVYTNGHWEQIPRAELSQLVLNEQVMQGMENGNVATELTNRQELFKVALPGERGAIHIGQFDPTPQARHGGGEVFQSFSTIRGESLASFDSDTPSTVWTADPGTIDTTALSITETPTDATGIVEVPNEPEGGWMIVAPLKGRRALEEMGGQQGAAAARTGEERRRGRNEQGEQAAAAEASPSVDQNGQWYPRSLQEAQQYQRGVQTRENHQNRDWLSQRDRAEAWVETFKQDGQITENSPILVQMAKERGQLEQEIQKLENRKLFKRPNKLAELQQQLQNHDAFVSRLRQQTIENGQIRQPATEQAQQQVQQPEQQPQPQQERLSPQEAQRQVAQLENGQQSNELRQQAALNLLRGAPDHLNGRTDRLVELIKAEADLGNGTDFTKKLIYHWIGNKDSQMINSIMGQVFDTNKYERSQQDYIVRLIKEAKEEVSARPQQQRQPQQQQPQQQQPQPQEQQQPQPRQQERGTQLDTSLRDDEIARTLTDVLSRSNADPNLIRHPDMSGPLTNLLTNQDRSPEIRQNAALALLNAPDTLSTPEAQNAVIALLEQEAQGFDERTPQAPFGEQALPRIAEAVKGGDEQASKLIVVVIEKKNNDSNFRKYIEHITEEVNRPKQQVRKAA
jgi:hypothetical protein